MRAEIWATATKGPKVLGIMWRPPLLFSPLTDRLDGRKVLGLLGLEAHAMMFWYDHNMGWWGWAGMGVGMLLFWALLIAGIVALVAYTTGDRRVRQIPPNTTPTASPEQILAARFAHGEINETEYRDRLAVLRDHAHT